MTHWHGPVGVRRRFQSDVTVVVVAAVVVVGDLSCSERRGPVERQPERRGGSGCTAATPPGADATGRAPTCSRNPCGRGEKSRGLPVLVKGCSLMRRRMWGRADELHLAGGVAFAAVVVVVAVDDADAKTPKCGEKSEINILPHTFLHARVS